MDVGAPNSAVDDRSGSYEVLVEDRNVRVDPVEVTRHARAAAGDGALGNGRAEGVECEPGSPWWADPPTVPGLLRMLWRILVRVLEYLGPADPPHVIAVIKAPERMYCANCGTERVAVYCPNCGQNVDRQYRKMIKRMARYVADGTADRRATIEAALRAHIDRSVALLQAQHRRLLHQRLRQLERHYVMEIARHRKAVRSLLSAPLVPPAPLSLEAPAPTTPDQADAPPGWRGGAAAADPPPAAARARGGARR